jgi:galactokinase
MSDAVDRVLVAADGTAGAAAQFRASYGRDPDAVFSAPGRVNLIGEHTDYNAGLVLPFAIDARAYVAIGRSSDGLFRVSSAQRPDDMRSATRDELTPEGSAVRENWAAYPFGVLWALAATGRPVDPVELALYSTVPVGAGLSSSAAVECAVALAVSTCQGLDLPLPELAAVAQRAENDFVGVPCGLMDQMASACSQDGHALFFDVGAGTTEQIPVDPVADGLAIQVVDTRAHHTLADGEFARRRADCECAAMLLGLPALSCLTAAELDTAMSALPEPVLRRRARHVVSENDRVRRVVRLLRAGRLDTVGDELTASHASLRDDFQVSSVELDVAVAAALVGGALGARMTGGGFGGSAIALVPRQAARSVTIAVQEAFDRQGFRPPVIREVAPAAGARRES